MGETIERHSAPPATFATLPRPDFSRIPAYVEPLRPAPAKQPHIPPGSASALLAVAVGTLLCFGAYVYMNQEPQPIPAEPVPSFVRSIEARVPSQDVPLPNGAAVAPAGHVKHPPVPPRHHPAPRGWPG